MAEYNGKQGHWVTTKEGRHLFIEDGENKAQAVRDAEASKLHKQALEGLDAEWSDFGRDEMDGIPSWQYISDDLQSEGGFSEKETEQIMSGKTDYDLTCKFLAFVAKREMSLNAIKGVTKKSLADALSWAVDTKISDVILNDILKYMG